MNKTDFAYKNISILDMDGEVWLPIFGYEGYYEISNMGRVKSVLRNVTNDVYGDKKVPSRILKQFILKNKYLSLSLNKEGKDKGFRVHRLVAIHHIPNPENKPEVNHKKGIKLDNRASELEWATRLENLKHAVNIGLINQKGIARYNQRGINSVHSKRVNQYSLSGKFIKTWDCIVDAVKIFNIDRSSVRRRGKSAGFYWKVNAINNNDLIITKKWQKA